MEKDKYTIGLGIRSHTLDIYGDKYYYLDNILHREDGPAIERISGYKAWYINGSIHRADGPAREWPNDNKEWWLNGKPLSCTTQKQFEQLMRLKAFW